MVQKMPRPPWRQSPKPRKRNPRAKDAFGYMSRAKANSVFSWQYGGVGKLLYSKAGYSRQVVCAAKRVMAAMASSENLRISDMVSQAGGGSSRQSLGNDIVA